MRPARRHVPPFGDYVEQANENQENIEYKRALVSTAAGSAKAVALLGPDSLHNVNSDADANLPSGIIAARQKYPEAHFKAGHMINACFRGDGKKPNNLTILTGSANTAMTAYDNRVKEAVQALYDLFKAFHKAKIQIGDIGTCPHQVEGDGERRQRGDNPPENYIAKEVSIKATFENVPVDRSSFIQDAIYGPEEHVKAIKRLQNRIGILVAQACGDIDNTL